jgi:hypothetical protein
MAEKKRKMPIFGQEVDVVDVPITKAVEHFNEYELEDGSVLRVKSVATSMIRIDGQYTPEGKPVYIVMTTPATSVVSSPLKPETKKEVTH